MLVVLDGCSYIVTLKSYRWFNAQLCVQRVLPEWVLSTLEGSYDSLIQSEEDVAQNSNLTLLD